MFPSDVKSAALRASANNDSPLEGLGEVVHKTKNVLKAIYSFASLGGVIGDIGLLNDAGLPAILPTGAIVTRAWVRLLADTTSAGAATVAVKVLAAADLVGATAVADMQAADNYVEGVPVGTVATYVGPVVAVPGSRITATVAAFALTAGIFEVFVEYVIQ